MAMKLNISYPPNGSQKLIELDDEKKSRLFFDRRIAEEVPADALGDDWKGYIVKITGGHDKQGFAMKQGVLLNHRTKLLLDGTTTGFHPWKRPGHRKRKSVRGCIIGPDIAVINAIIIKKGEQDLPGLTDPDSVKPSLRGPKRANNIRKLWGLSKEEDVRQFVSRKKKKDRKDGKPRFVSPKIQRLITPKLLARKKRLLRVKKQRREKAQKDEAEYKHLLANIRREKRKALISKKRAQSERKSQRLSERAEPGEKPETKTKKTKKEEQPKDESKAKKAKTTTKPEEKGKDKPAAGKDTGKKGQPAAKPAAKPAAGKDTGKKDTPAKGAPAAKPAAGKDTGKKEAQPAAKPAEKPAAKTAEKPAAKKDQPAAKPADKPAAKKESQPAAKPADKPAAQPAAKQPAAKPADKPAPKKDEPAKKPPAKK